MKNKNNINFINNISKDYLINNKLTGDKKIISKEIKRVAKSISIKKDTFHTLSKNYKFDFKYSDFKRYNKYKKIFFIGMCGSILGIKAAYSFLKQKIKKKCYFIDNLEQEKIFNFSKKKQTKNSLFIIISKSGNTLETITNINLLSKVKFNSKNTIVITEKKNNAIFNFAKNLKISIVEHKSYVCGRYSVLSEAGILPLYLMGLDTKKIRSQILTHFKEKKLSYLIDSVCKMAQIYSAKRINSIIFFNYSNKFNDFTYWCQQLISESLGKNKKGLMPIISKAPKDHHSLLQLYLDGPKDKIFYILSTNLKENIKVKKNIFGNSFNYLKNKNLDKILFSQKKAFINVLKKKNIPYREIQIDAFSEEVIGNLFSFFIIETVLIAKLINVNPFDQPAVERVKILTKKYLS